ncbi:DoxX family membrane protein [Streptomyces sp. DSM 44915]|uniref:DoxX family membrane protein n=1 Tax=Streptomyces chisholmiae TaxID=3075540 RepID=A0ABU2JSU9_9ACTN|nr:DoxX family membrane protein [Streptomyces sp. DSM 44915]MDT0267574.1 DoxX family membrane protein [Streptomyces sp. DSM 44915]
MSVDTRTLRGRPMDEPVLSMVKVPCDPAQVVVNHASFRVRLATPPPVSIVLPGAAGLTGAAGGKRRPLVWSGRSEPGDRAAGSLLQAVRAAGEPGAALATEVLPRIGAGARAVERVGTVVAPRPPHSDEITRPLPTVPAGPGDRGQDTGEFAARLEPGPTPRAGHGGGRSRARAFHPDRRLSLGLVLLPLRLLLGFMAIYAGMGKLTDPVYFDGGERGSLYTWLASLDPWVAAAPLHDWTLAHPVGAGLTVAFLQIVVGVLTLFGLWQRLAALLGAALSLALLTTVSWQHGPAYDTPEVVLFAAWTPLVIAGAPVHSLDARLASEAWRRLGPRAPLAQLRRRVLRRGGLLAALLLGVALLVGSLLGSAVRSAQFATVPEPGEPPRNHLPGEPLVDEEAEAREAEEREAVQRAETERQRAEERAAEQRAEEERPSAPPTEDPTQPAQPSPEEQREAPVPDPVPEQPQDSVPAAPSSPEDGSGGDPGTGGVEEPGGETGGAEDDGGDQSSPDPLGGLLG